MKGKLEDFRLIRCLNCSEVYVVDKREYHDVIRCPDCDAPEGYDQKKVWEDITK